MRVVAGSVRGLRLAAPDGDETRPTSDRVREAVFNSLHSLGGIEDASVVDLYAGSGALGIEALSRGASHVTFVDQSHRSIEAITANLEHTGFDEAATVQRTEVTRFLESNSGAFDLALVDPPYTFDDWEQVLDRLDAALVVVESDREISAHARWDVVRAKRYGGTVVTMLAPAAGTPQA